MPPFFVAIIPSALFPRPVQMDVHFCPAAITPGISVTVYSLGAGAAAAACPAPPARAPPPPAPPPPRWAGSFLQLLALNSAYLASWGAWTPGPCCGAAAGAAGGGAGVWPNMTIALRQPSTTSNTPFDFINTLRFPSPFGPTIRQLNASIKLLYRRPSQKYKRCGGWADAG